jgi:hypothetical protein
MSLMPRMPMMTRHSQNERRLLSKTLSTWSLSLVMMGMCSGQLMAADAPPQIQVNAEKTVTAAAFTESEGVREDPVQISIKMGDSKIIVVRDVRYKISKMIGLSLDYIEINGMGQWKYNERIHDLDISSLNEEEQVELRKNYKDSLINLLLGIREGNAKCMKSMMGKLLELTIDFKGGSVTQLLKEFANAIEEAYVRQLPKELKGIFPDRLKIEVMVNDSGPRLGALKFSNETLSKIVIPGFIAKDLFSPFLSLDFNSYSSAEEGNEINVWNLTTHTSSPDFVTDFFNVGDMPKMRSTGSVISVPNVAALFELAWTMNSNVVWANTKFHPETGMLIVKGTKSEIEIAKTAFNTLRGISTVPNPLDQISNILERLIEIQSEIQTRSYKDDGKESKGK